MQRTWSVRSSEDLGRAVGDIRRHRGLTQADLSVQAGLDRSWLAKLESGRPSKVLDHLLRLLRRLGATVTITLPDDRTGDGRGEA